jgi:hypothetical protein
MDQPNQQPQPGEPLRLHPVKIEGDDNLWLAEDLASCPAKHLVKHLASYRVEPISQQFCQQFYSPFNRLLIDRLLIDRLLTLASKV